MQFSQRVYHYQSYLNACLKYLSGFFFPQCPQQQYYVGFFKCLACYCYIELNTEVKSNANIKNQQMAKNINYELDVKILIVYYEIILMLMIILLLDIVFLHQDVKLKNQFNPLYLNKIIKEILENYQILIYDQNRFSIINVNAIKVNSNIAFENIVMILAQAFVATLQPDIDSLKMLMNYERSLSLVLQMKLKFLVIVNKQKYFVNKINIIF
ncbi:unnamed protein product [Paramecium pentaurelia]|uniref:Transmembrane protein n=1 Tax=Paramecium pentaurelia TaxID=43138 RepID=A0A8S1TWG5_9CILI|nr:unnamed protein product [Paramecium pentaurelia]